MSGYELPGIKLLNRIYKTENRRNGNLGPVFFYNNFLVNNKKVGATSGDTTGDGSDNVIGISYYDVNGDGYIIIPD